MPTLLDERPAPRGRLLFGHALVQQQNAEAEAMHEAQREQEFAINQQRLNRATAEQQRFHDEQLQLHQRAIDLQEKAQRVNEQKAHVLLDAANVKLDWQMKAQEQFGKAAVAVGKLDPKADDYDEQLAQIKADHPDAFTIGGDTTKSLDELISSKTSARDMWAKSQADLETQKRKKEDEAARMDQARSMGLAPNAATIGGFSFKKLETPETFDSPADAQKKYPNARLRGSVDADGKFTVEHLEVKPSEEKSSGLSSDSSSSKTATSDDPTNISGRSGSAIQQGASVDAVRQRISNSEQGEGYRAATFHDLIPGNQNPNRPALSDIFR